MYRKKILIAAILTYGTSHNESARFGRTNQEAAETRSGLLEGVPPVMTQVSRII
jgi:hypothetical protein